MGPTGSALPLKQLREHLECPICMSEVGDRFLHCGHSFCSNCIRQLILTNSTGSSARYLPASIQCPACRKPTASPLSGTNGDRSKAAAEQWIQVLPINYTAKNVQNVLQTVVWCPLHSDYTCDHWCWTCTKAICALDYDSSDLPQHGYCQEHDHQPLRDAVRTSRNRMNLRASQVSNVYQQLHHWTSASSLNRQVIERQINELEQLWIEGIHAAKQRLLLTLQTHHDQQASRNFADVDLDATATACIQVRTAIESELESPTTLSTGPGRQEISDPDVISYLKRISDAMRAQNGTSIPAQVNLHAYQPAVFEPSFPWRDGLLGQVLLPMDLPLGLAHVTDGSTSASPSRQRLEERQISERLNNIEIGPEQRSPKRRIA